MMRYYIPMEISISQTPPYGLEKYIDDSTKAAPYQGVYRVGTNGKVDLLVDSINRLNGIGLMPDGKTLLVANSESEKAVWYAFDLELAIA